MYFAYLIKQTSYLAFLCWRAHVNHARKFLDKIFRIITDFNFFYHVNNLFNTFLHFLPSISYEAYASELDVSSKYLGNKGFVRSLL